MTAWDDKDSEGRALWNKSRAAFLRDTGESGPETGPGLDQLVDPMIMAAYLEGRLPIGESEALEASLAGSEASLDLLIASREALALAPDPVSDRVLRRAQSLTGFELRTEKQGFFALLFGGSLLQSLAGAGSFAAFLLICVFSFNLGQGEGVALAGLDEGRVQMDLDEDFIIPGFGDEFVVAGLGADPGADPGADTAGERGADPLWDLDIEDVL